MLAPAQIPHMEVVPVLPAEQEVRHESVLDHVRRAPLAGDLHVMPEMPGEVVGEMLRAAIHFPAPEHVERIVIEHEEATGTVAVGRAEGAHVDAFGPAVKRMRPRVAGTL